MVINTQLVIVDQGVGKYCTVSVFLPYMPCLRHAKNSLAVIHQTYKFLQMEVCTDILAAVPARLSTTHHASNKETCAVDVDFFARYLVCASAY
jgi:hypothetical protein